MSTVRILSLLALGLVLTACVSVGDLDEKIAAKQTEMTKVRADLHAAAVPKFTLTGDVASDIRYRPLQAWLGEVTVPEYRIHAVGVDGSRRDDIIYVPNVGKAYLEPERDTIFELFIGGVQLQGSNTGLTWGSQFRAAMESRVHTHIANVGSSVKCTGRIDSVGTGGSLTLAPLSGDLLPYALSVSYPAGLSVPVNCGLGQLGSWNQTFWVDGIAKDISKGSFNLGFTSSGAIDLPAAAGGKRLNYTVTFYEPTLAPHPDGISYAAKADLVISGRN